MASQAEALAFIFMSSIFLVLAGGINGGEIGIYWGQDGSEGSLQAICDTSNVYFKYISIAYLNKFGPAHPEPEIDLNTHCNPQNDGCAFIGDEIRACQAKGVKVLLSIGGPGENYDLKTLKEATDLADYLWNHFLGGNSILSFRPFGEAILDGIDFDIQRGDNSEYDDLAEALSNYFNKSPLFTKKYYLTASPGCVYPDLWLRRALNTGVFDFVWPKFYNNTECDYVYNIEKVKAVWKYWSSPGVRYTKVFLGLPAAKEAVKTGFITSTDLKQNVLPVIKDIKLPQKFGGVMLWSRYYDIKTKYSSEIAPYV